MSNRSASPAIQQAFSKPCLVNLISKDTHLVFYNDSVDVDNVKS